MLARLLTKLVTGHFFRNVIGRNVQIYLVKILCYWYQHQEMIVHCTMEILFIKCFFLLQNCYNWGNRINDMLYADDFTIKKTSVAFFCQT